MGWVVDKKGNALPAPDRYAWWNEEGDTPASTLFQNMRYWDNIDAAQQIANLKYFRMYTGRGLFSNSIANYVAQTAADAAYGETDSIGPRRSRITLNVVRSVIDTWVSKMTKQDIKPSFLTAGGALEQRDRAEKLSKFLYGLFNECRIEQKREAVMQNGGIFGTGFGEVLTQNDGRIGIMSAFSDEVFVDPAVGYYQEPSEMYRRKFVSRSRLMAEFPELAGKISTVKGVADFQTIGSQNPDTVLLVKAYALARPGLTEGRYIEALDGVVLVDRPFRGRHRLIPYRRRVLPVGFYGQGFCEELEDLQREINYTIMSIREALRRMSKPWIFRERGSRVSAGHIDTAIGSIVDYTGTPPIIQTIQAVAPDKWRYLLQLVTWAYELSGVSQLSANSHKPAGLESGAALREYADLESERFLTEQRRSEWWHVDLAEALIDEVEYNHGDNYVVSATTKENGVEKLRWGDVKLPRDEPYYIRVFPTSALPQHPSARLDTVANLMQSGLIEPQIGLALLNFPDLEPHLKRQLAPLNWIMKSLEDMLLTADPDRAEPDPDIDLNLQQRIAQQYLAWAMLNDLDKDRIQMVRDFIDDVRALSQRMQQQAQQQAMAQQIGTPAQGVVEQGLQAGAVPAAPPAAPGMQIGPSQFGMG